MTYYEILILGIIQGLTEFLPVSSSGHLVIFQNLLGFTEPALLLDCSLHMGTLIAICFYFRSDLKKILRALWQSILRPGCFHDAAIKEQALLGIWVVIGTIPTALIGLTFRKHIEALFASMTAVGIMLVVTGVLIFLSKLVPKSYGTQKEIGVLRAVAVGAAQGFAILPGISRAGTTITCGLLCGLNRELAGRFSFLLSIPAIIGALAVQLSSSSLEGIGLVPLLFGFTISALIGLGALKLLMHVVKKGHLYYFAPYCWAIGLVVLFYQFFKG